jgi:dienelactone hydrolase
MEKRLKLFDYDQSQTKRERKKLKAMYHNHRAYNLTLTGDDPTSNNPLRVNFTYYKNTKGGTRKLRSTKVKVKKRPLIIMVPPILDQTPLDFALGKYLISKGYHIFLMKFGDAVNDPKREFKKTDDWARRVTTRFRLLIDYAHTLPEIQKENIGAYGMSLGGCLIGLFLGVEKRLKSGVIIVGGGNLPHILSHSKQFVVTGYVKARMKAEKIKTKEEVEKYLQRTLKIDSLYFAKKIKINKQHVYMVISEDDPAVPSKAQYQLYEAFDKPEIKIFPKGHFKAILKNLKRANHGHILEFFVKTIGRVK